MRRMSRVLMALCMAGAATTATGVAEAANRDFSEGSLIIPMDLAYQDHGLLQAYGLVFHLLRNQVRVYWVIDPEKTWHAAPCDTAGDECTWDCAEQGSGIRCPYPTASPDFFAASKVVWDGDGTTAAGTAIASHGYRGGPFVIDSADRDRALALIDAWNDKSKWPANPWAKRTVFQAVSVHESTAGFKGFVRKEMVAAPTIAVFSDGNENIATGYLRAAGIPQSTGAEFPDGKCAAGTCGAGTPNPDMLTVPSVAGDMGTCDAPNKDHRNGQLFRNGVPAYCQIMSMHWAVNDRETVECGGGSCGTDQASCGGKTITYHGHEVVAEVRAFLEFPVHFFAECQAVNAYENTTPNPAWPYLDDDGRDGHFLTTTGTPPACGGGAACTDGDFQCTTGGCSSGAQDCCLPKDVKEKGAGFLIAQQPASDDIKVLHPDVPYNQLDGDFATVGGSEPAYNLSSYLGTKYKNDREVTFLTGASGPGLQDVWMTGYLDGDCDISEPPIIKKFADGGTGAACGGKVSYLGGHSYSTNVPVSGNPNTQGTRLFLNALFEADCVTSEGQPQLSVNLTGDTHVSAASPQGSYTIGFVNSGQGSALDGSLQLGLPAGVSAVETGGGTVDGSSVLFPIAAIGPQGSTAPPSIGSHQVKLTFASTGSYVLTGRLVYRVGATELIAGPVTLGVGVGVEPPAPDGGTDGGGGSAGTAGSAGAAGAESAAGDDGGCGCRVGSHAAAGGWLLFAVGLVLRMRRPLRRPL